MILIKKNYTFIIIVVLLILTVTAYSNALNNSPQNPNETSMQWKSFNIDNEVLLEGLREKRGYYIFQSSDAKSDDLYFGVFMGIKPSSGYDVLMGSVLLGEEDMLTIAVKEISPIPDQQVSDVETYPYLLFMIPGSADKDFIIISEDGEEFTQLIFE